PHARPAHRDAGEIDAAAIAVKLAEGLLEGRKGLLLLLAIPLLAETALREDDEGFVAVAVALERRSESEGKLAEVVVAALAAAVKEEDDGPAAQLREVRRQPDPVLEGV